MRNNVLDYFRWLLALAVVVEHCNVIWPINIPFPLKSNIAVYSFFVLSGYFTHVSLHKYSIQNFYRNRIVRIIPQYVAVIITTAILFIPLLGFQDLEKYLTANIFGLNFLQYSFGAENVKMDYPVLNGSLWSIKYEVLYFMLAPMIFNRNIYIKYGLIVILSLLYMFVNSIVIAYLLLFLLGDLFRNRNIGLLIVSPLLIIFPASIFYSVVLTCSIILLSGYAKSKMKIPDWSYEIYLIHFPVLEFTHQIFPKGIGLTIVLFIVFLFCLLWVKRLSKKYALRFKF